MPMLTMLRIGLPVWPFHAPERILVAKSAIRSKTSCTWATTSTPSTISVAPFDMRRATCRTERFSDTLIRSPKNIHVPTHLEIGLLGQLKQQIQDLVGDAVLGVIQI